MSIIEAIVLAIVQGLTEFLPVSSSGHLVLARWLFGWEDPGLDFDVAVHVGTLAAILAAFRREIWAVLSGLREDRRTVDDLRPRRLLVLGVVGTIPIVIVGALFYDALESELRSATAAGAFLLATGALIGAAEWRLRRWNSSEPLSRLDTRRALAVGLSQCLAIVPGLSRSGMCMVAGMALGHSRGASARWAFWLSIPALGGAGVLAVASLIDERGDVDATALTIGAIVSFLTALAAIRGLLWLVRGRTLAPFAVYCVIAGGAVLIARAAGA